MSGDRTRPGQRDHLELASLRSGQDWAGWLGQARPAKPLSNLGGRSPQALARAWAALVHLARREGFAVERGDCADGDAFTTWRDRRIHVRRGAAPGQAVMALAHQLGHVLLHGEIAYLDRSGTVACRGIRKVEADSVAYLAAARLGIDASVVAFPHIASWAGTDPRAHPAATVQAVSDRVLTAAATIAAHIDDALADGATSAQLRAVRADRGRQASRPEGGAALVGLAGGRGGEGAHTGQQDPAISSRSGAGASHATATSQASRACGARADTGSAPPHAPANQLRRLQDTAARFFRGRLPGSWVPGYLAARGFGTGLQQRWQAGYAPAGWDTLTRHLRDLGYRDAVIEAAGLARRSWRGTLIDTFRDRAMLPIRAIDGTVVGFIGRAPDGAEQDVPKYLNSPRTELYKKGEVLFGLCEGHDLLAMGSRPVIVEGPFDAISVSAACPARYVGVASCGAALTSQQVAALAHTADLPATGVLVAFDSDSAGRQAAVKAYRLLITVTDAVTAVILPAGQDPAQILRDHGAAALAAILSRNAQPLADLVIDAEADRWKRWLRHAEGQINALRAAAPLIAAMPPAQVARQVARLAHRLGLDYPTVTEAVTDALTELAANTEGPRAPQTAALDTTGRNSGRGPVAGVVPPHDADAAAPGHFTHRWGPRATMPQHLRRSRTAGPAGLAQPRQ